MIHKKITMVVASDIESLIIMVVEILSRLVIDGNDKMISILLMLFVIQKEKEKENIKTIQRVVRLITGGCKHPLN